MTVNTETERALFEGTGLQTAFPYTFPILQDADMQVRLIDADGLETVLVQDTNYTITGAGTDVGGDVTIIDGTSAPEVGEQLLLIRLIAYTQPTDFKNQGRFFPRTHEKSFDRVTMQAIRLAGGLARALRLYDQDTDGSGRYDANGNRIADLADGVNPTDAATVQQVIGAGSGNFIAAGTGAVTRTMQNKARDIVSVKDFGAVGDGVTNDTAAIQSALDAGLRVYFPLGDYLVNAAISITDDYTTVYGEGQGSRIITSSGTADVFTVGDGATEIIGVCFRNIAIDAAVAKTAGRAINARLASRSRLENVFIGRPEDSVSPPNHFNGVYFDRFDYCTIYACHIAASNIAVACRGNVDQSFGAGLFIEGGTKITCANSAGSFGVVVGGGAGGVYFNACDIIDCGTGIFISKTLTAINNREIFVSSLCSIDGSLNSGLFVDADSIVQLDLTGTWIATSGKTNPAGVAINIGGAQPAGMFLGVTGARLFNNAGGGITLNGGGANITGCKMRLNGKGAGGGHAIHAVAAAVQEIVISGNTIVNNGTVAKGYGVVLEAGVNSYVIVGNMIRTNLQGQIIEVESGPNALIANNLLT